MITNAACFLKLIFLLLASFFTSTIFSQSIITVTNNNSHGWVKEEQHLGKIYFTDGPSNPPLHKGSLQFCAPENGAPRRWVRMRNIGYAGLRLASITHLSYSSFVQKAESKVDAPFIVLQVDCNGDGIKDTHMVFHVRFQSRHYTKATGIRPQGPIQEKAWQTWDAFNGAWFTGPTLTPDTGAPVYSFSSFVAQHPNAQIVNDSTGGGIRLQAGGLISANNFIGNADAFTLGINGKITVYDFELSADTAKNSAK